MKQRVITGAISAVLLIIVLALGTPFVEIAVVALALVGVHELLAATKLAGNKKLAVVSMAGSLCIMVGQSFDKAFFMPALYLLVVALFVLFMANRDELGLSDIATALFVVLYPTFMMGHLIHIRAMENGGLLIWAVFISAFLTDTMAMFGGKFFGKHKLCPSLSPKKTVEGSVSGVLGCVVSFFVYCYVCGRFFDVTPNYLNALVISLGASLVAQLGDLSASCIKRQFGIKDYGKIMPGHGGIMDRFDSVLFVAPFIYYMLFLLPVFN